LVVSSTQPTVFTLTGSSICAPNTGTIKLSNSQSLMSYQLKDNNNLDVQAPKTGAAGSSLTWTALGIGNGYYVIATNPSGCTSQTSTADVAQSNGPTVYALTGSSVCSP